MARIGLAFRCFFKLLLGGDLPADAVRYLPEGATAGQLPEAGAARRGDGSRAGDGESGGEAASPAGKGPARAADDAGAADRDDRGDGSDRAAARKPARSAAGTGELHRDGALAFLALLQREGRLLDFLRESLDDYEDSDIGAAVRDIHRGCKKVIDEHLTIEPVMPGEEESDVTVPRGFDPHEIRLVGESTGEPPFKGVLRHHGWRVTDVSLPTLGEGVDRRVLAPAEVEVK